MLKLKIVVCLFVCALFLNVDNCVAQTNESFVSIIDSDFSDFEKEKNLFERGIFSSNENTVRVKDAALMEMEYDAKVSEDFGVYLNPISNVVKLKTSNKFAFNKIQITNTGSGQTVKSSDFSYSNNLINLSKVGSGSYIVILTDDNGNVYSDKFSIMN